MGQQYLLLSLLLLFFITGCSGSKNTTQAAPPQTTPVLLEGDLATLASTVVTDKSAGPADTKDMQEGFILNRIDVALKSDATVGQINAALQSVSGGIISMKKGSPHFTISVPKQENKEALQKLAEELSKQEGIAFTLPGHEGEMNIGPGGNLADAGNHGSWNHLFPTRFPAAWNVKNAAQGCNGQLIPIIVPDWFSFSEQSQEFSERVPNFRFVAGADEDSGHSPHGTLVTTMITTTQNGQAPVGANPLPECLAIRGIQVASNTSFQQGDRIHRSLLEVLHEFPNGPFIINIAQGLNSNITLVKRLHHSLFFKQTFGNFLGAQTPLIVSAAGNENQRAPNAGLKLARYASAQNISTIPNDQMFQETADAGLFGNQALSPQDLELLRHFMREFGIEGIPPASNVIIVGSVDNLGDSLNPALSQESSFSQQQPDVYVVGEGISFGNLANGGRDVRGTSFAAPQVTGLASYLWLLRPELRGLPAQRTKQLILANVWPGGLPIVDAYASVLALDDAAPCTPGNCPIRLALFDANNSRAFDEEDLEAFIRQVAIYDERGNPRPVALDFSRFDLNGDGFTGGLTTSRFDLDRVGSQKFGVTQYGRAERDIEGGTFSFNEQQLTDLDILCYYAYSDLYSGRGERRRELLASHCANITGLWCAIYEDFIGHRPPEPNPNHQPNCTGWTNFLRITQTQNQILGEAFFGMCEGKAPIAAGNFQGNLLSIHIAPNNFDVNTDCNEGATDMRLNFQNGRLEGQFSTPAGGPPDPTIYNTIYMKASSDPSAPVPFLNR